MGYRNQVMVAMIVIWLLGGCSAPDNPPPVTPEETPMSEQSLAEMLIGRWRRESAEACAGRYPTDIEWLEGGVYLASQSDEVFYIWQSGDYEIVDDHTVKVQTATDAMLSYAVEVDGERLAVADDTGCRVIYTRQP